MGGDLAPMLGQRQAIFRLKLKKVRETTRTFSYDLNQIPYDYIVEMKNRLMGLDLVVCRKVDGDLQHCTGSSQKNHPQEKQICEGKVVA